MSCSASSLPPPPSPPLTPVPEKVCAAEEFCFKFSRVLLNYTNDGAQRMRLFSSQFLKMKNHIVA